MKPQVTQYKSQLKLDPLAEIQTLSYELKASSSICDDVSKEARLETACKSITETLVGLLSLGVKESTILSYIKGNEMICKCSVAVPAVGPEFKLACSKSNTDFPKLLFLDTKEYIHRSSLSISKGGARRSNSKGGSGQPSRSTRKGSRPRRATERGEGHNRVVPTEKAVDPRRATERG